MVYEDFEVFLFKSSGDELRQMSDVGTHLFTGVKNVDILLFLDSRQS